jgi:hypothetical protein
MSLLIIFGIATSRCQTTTTGTGHSEGRRSLRLAFGCLGRLGIVLNSVAVRGFPDLQSDIEASVCYVRRRHSSDTGSTSLAEKESQSLAVALLV